MSISIYQVYPQSTYYVWWFKLWLSSQSQPNIPCCMVEISDKCSKPPISDSTTQMALVKFKNKQWDLQ